MIARRLVIGLLDQPLVDAMVADVVEADGLADGAQLRRNLLQSPGFAGQIGTKIEDRDITRVDPLLDFIGLKQGRGGHRT